MTQWGAITHDFCEYFVLEILKDLAENEILVPIGIEFICIVRCQQKDDNLRVRSEQFDTSYFKGIQLSHTQRLNQSMTRCGQGELKAPKFWVFGKSFVVTSSFKLLKKTENGYRIGSG